MIKFQGSANAFCAAPVKLYLLGESFIATGFLNVVFCSFFPQLQEQCHVPVVSCPSPTLPVCTSSAGARRSCRPTLQEDANLPAPAPVSREASKATLGKGEPFTALEASLNATAQGMLTLNLLREQEFPVPGQHYLGDVGQLQRSDGSCPNCQVLKDMFLVLRRRPPGRRWKQQ